MKKFSLNNPLIEGMFDLFVLLFKVFGVVFIIISLMVFANSDFVERMKHQTYGNCVKNLTTAYALPFITYDEQGTVIEYEESDIIDPEGTAEQNCAQLFDVR